MSEAFRSEHDTMGSVRVPAGAYWGAQTARARENFTVSGQPIPRALIRALGLLKGAAAAANRELGRLSPEFASAIERAATEVADGRLDREFVVDVFQTGSGTSSNMNANEVVANRAGELLGQPLGSGAVHANDHVNLGQSSNDVFPTAVQLALVLLLQDRLLPELRELAASLHALADCTFAQVKTGRTHLMAALPIRFGQEFRGYAAQVQRGTVRVQEAMFGLCEVPLGGTAVGTGANTDPRFAARVCALVAERCGAPLRETRDHFQAQACLDAVVHASAALRTFATALFKIANDVRWMVALGEVRIPEVQPGSSIMPAKVNPVICESVLMACAQVCGNDGVVAFGNSQGQFELNTMMPLLARNALESAELLANGVRMFRERCIAGVEVVPAAAARVHENPMLATALAPAIGYEHAARIAKEAAARGVTVREVAAADPKCAGLDLDRLLDPGRIAGDGGRAR